MRGIDNRTLVRSPLSSTIHHAFRFPRLMRRSTFRVTGAACAALACLTVSSSVGAQKGARDGEWREYGADLGGTKYSPLSQISADNIQQVQVAWEWPSPDRSIQTSDPLMRSTRNEDTPLYVDGVLYTVTPLGMVAALDPGTGETKWLFDPEVYKEGKPA